MDRPLVCQLCCQMHSWVAKSGMELKPVAEALGLDWSRRILANYLALMELCRQSFDPPFSDLTFENFVGLSVDMGELLPVCILQGVEE